MTQPYPYQERGIAKIGKFNGRALLADEMGLGKTLQALLWLKQNPQSLPAVVVCPAFLKINWQREASVHINLRTEILDGRRPTKLRRRLRRPTGIFIINYEILKHWKRALEDIEIQTVVLDEAQYIKNRRAIRTKAVRALCKKIPHVIALSGTPLTNRPAELWPTLNVVRPDLYPAFQPFAHRYCAPKRNRWGWEYKGATNLKELRQALKKNLMIRRRKAQVLHELPEQQRFVVPLSLPPVRLKEYERATNDFIRWLREISPAKAKRAAKAQAVTKIGYLRRLIAGLKMDQVIEWIDTFLEESEGKLAVFGIHKDVISSLHTKFRRLSVVVSGEVSARKRQLAVDEFQHCKKTRLFIGNIQAAGVGLNLTAASTGLIVEVPWTPGELSQVEARLHRIGQTKKTSWYYPVVAGTVEERLCLLLQQKQQILDDILDGKETHEDSLDVFDQLINILNERTPNERRKTKR